MITAAIGTPRGGPIGPSSRSEDDLPFKAACRAMAAVAFPCLSVHHTTLRMQTIEHTMTWRRFDLPGLDAAYFGATATGWRLCGTAIFASESGPCHLGYAVDADERWQTRCAHVFGTIGATLVDLHIAARGRDSGHAWTVNGDAQPDADGCIDLDLGFTTAARLFTLRRLAPVDGQEVVAPVAQLHLPDGELGAVTERYLRLHEHALRFSSTAGSPSIVLAVDAHLAVLRYPGRWDSEAFPRLAAGAAPLATARASRSDYQAALPANAEALRAAATDRIR